MSVFYPYKMERRGRSRGHDFLSANNNEIFKRAVTRITNLHQLAEVEEMDGNEKEADEIRHTAVHCGMKAIVLTELNEAYKHALDSALEWLRGRDYEMHKAVKGTFDQARATIDITRRMRRSQT